MYKLKVSLALLVAVVLVLVSARTRYEEYQFRACEAVTDGSVKDLRSEEANRKCQAHCGGNGYPFGGCDCKTKLCVCADMNLDFCHFQEIRIYI